MVLTELDQWGPNFWQTLHTLTFTYPNRPTARDRRIYYHTLRYIGLTLPCPVCRRDYLAYLKKYPPNLESRFTLSRYMVDLHNEVNRKLNKSVVDYDTVLDMYMASPAMVDRTPRATRPRYHCYLLYALLVAIGMMIVACGTKYYYHVKKM